MNIKMTLIFSEAILTKKCSFQLEGDFYFEHVSIIVEEENKKK